MHRIEVRNKPGQEGEYSKGATTELYIDGQLAKGVKSFKYEVNAASMGSVTIEYYADVVVDCSVPDIVANEILLAETQVPVIGKFSRVPNKKEDKGE